MPYADPTIPDTLFVDATDLQLLDGIVFAEDALAGVLAPALLKASNDDKPGADGEWFTDRPLAAWTFPIPLTVLPTTGTDAHLQRASVIANFTALIAVCRGSGSDGKITLKRRLSTSGGHVDHTANGGFEGLNGPAQWLDMTTLSVVLQFRNLDGSWTDGVSRIVP